VREIVHTGRREELVDAELGSLTRALGETDRELRALRALLAELRAHAL
jgi:hypothetical protein